MVNVTLGDLEEYAIRESNGNLSGFLRQIIKEYKENKQINQQTNNLVLYMFIMIGNSFLFGFLSFLLPIPIIAIISYIFFLLSGLFLILGCLILLKKQKLIKKSGALPKNQTEGGEKWTY